MANINISSHRGRPYEDDTVNPHALVSFRAIVAGLLIAMFCMLGLLGLGLAFGGIGLGEETSAQSAGIFTGVWFIISSLISVFLGSYFAARVSKFKTGRIGSAQGIVIAALFLGFFLYQTMMAVGSAGSAAGAFLGKTGTVVAQGAQQVSQNPQVANTVHDLAEDALSELNLKSPPNIVAQGVAARLVRGDTNGAKNYLSRQAGITPTEADARIAQMRARIDHFLAEAKETTATALRSVGWSLFFLVALSAFAGIGGGALGSVANFRRPLVRETAEFQYQGNEFHA